MHDHCHADPMLFNAAGNLVLFNDDSNGLQSRISATGLASGSYYVAISSYANGYNQVSLDSPWNKNGFYSGNYQINLTGAEAVQATPEPSTLISGVIAGLVALGYNWSRRKAKHAD